MYDMKGSVLSVNVAESPPPAAYLRIIPEVSQEWRDWVRERAA